MFQSLESLFNKLYMQIYEDSANDSYVRTFSILLSNIQKHNKCDTQTHFIKMDQSVLVTNNVPNYIMKSLIKFWRNTKKCIVQHTFNNIHVV